MGRQTRDRWEDRKETDGEADKRRIGRLTDEKTDERQIGSQKRDKWGGK
jgi:hypothetical protein